MTEVEDGHIYITLLYCYLSHETNTSEKSGGRKGSKGVKQGGK